MPNAKHKGWSKGSAKENNSVEKFFSHLMSLQQWRYFPINKLHIYLFILPAR